MTTIITKLGNKLEVKDDVIAKDMVEKNAGWKIEGEDDTPKKPSRKKAEVED